MLFCVQGYAQDTPSLGDVARQAKKDKSDKPPAKVFTNDDMSTGSSASSSPATASGGKNQSASQENSGEIHSSAEGLQKLQSALDGLASLDRATLADNVLDGNETNFPGRAAWEEKLFAAKQLFVEQTRLTVQKAKDIAVSGMAIQGAEDKNDPRVKSISAKLDQLVQETQRNRASFQAVVAEGRALAGLPDAQ